mmetsp:Transcript_51438/g.160495  ORF Transcript_51438/g.160495 Transcript_51438/m.160495 type:complete len:221 (-) Transcript_51438:433-1095(-)
MNQGIEATTPPPRVSARRVEMSDMASLSAKVRVLSTYSSSMIRIRTSSFSSSSSSICSSTRSKGRDASSPISARAPVLSCSSASSSKYCFSCAVRGATGRKLNNAISPSTRILSSQALIPTTGTVRFIPSCLLSPGAIRESSELTTTIARPPAAAILFALSTKVEEEPEEEPLRTTTIFPRMLSAFRKCWSANSGSAWMTSASTSSYIPNVARMNSILPF